MQKKLIQPSKNIRIVSTPETQPDFPRQPEYEPLWSWQKIDDELWRCFYNGKLSVNLVQALCEQIAADYDKALSLAQFNLWQSEGIYSQESPPVATE